MDGFCPCRSPGFLRRRLGQVLSQVLMPYFPNATNGRSLRAAFLLPSRVRTVPPQFAPKMPFRATKIKKSECARQGEICPAGRKSCPLLPGGFSCSKEHIGVSAHSLNTLRVASGQLLRRFPRVERKARRRQPGPVHLAKVFESHGGAAHGRRKGPAPPLPCGMPGIVIARFRASFNPTAG